MIKYGSKGICKDTQKAITYQKPTIETLVKGVKYVQTWQQRRQRDVIDDVLLFL